VDVRRLGASLGGEVTDLDPANPFPPDVIDVIRKALLDHQVLVLRPRALSSDDHLALGRAFGPTEVHTFFPNLGDGYEQISVLDSTVPGSVASMWHTDETFLDRPPMATLLHAEVIPVVGGDTVWASSTAAYDALSASMKRYLDGLVALHDLSRTVELKHQFGGATADELAASIASGRRRAHPIVCTHPETGAKGLYVNPTYTRSIVGVAPDESSAILAYLFAHATKEHFTFRHRWTAGDLVIWDNRSTMHMAMNDFVGHRRMLRVSVLGVDQPA
jgi:taurine dioxygenase